MVWSGLSHDLRTTSESAAWSFAPPAVAPWCAMAFYVIGLTLMHEAGRLPITYYGGFFLERRYGLSSQRFTGWLLNQAKSVVLVMVLGTFAAGVVYGFMRAWPDTWWLPAGAVFALLIVGLAHLGPVLLLPLFYRVEVVDRESLRLRLVALAERAGTRVLGVYQCGFARETRKANAALTGLGPTRRILVSETMLAEYSDEEIEIVLAHELAHHVHGDIWTGLALESTLIVAGLYAAARALDGSADRLGLLGSTDVAGLPLMILALETVSLVALPVAHAMSRSHERRADRVALELTRNPDAFVSAMRRLAAQNLAEERPSRIVQWLFYSHPPTRERIAAAQAFRI
jgi:STE24 endopeptidase